MSMLKCCKPATIDVSKEFEKNLVNGILYCTNDNNTDVESIENAPLESLKTLWNKYYKVVSETENITLDHAQSTQQSQNQKSPDKQVAKQSSKRAMGAFNSSYTSIAADDLNSMLDVLIQQTSHEPKDFNKKYCCWARQRVLVKHTQTKHGCPYLSCVCCCKELLKDFYANTSTVKTTKSIDKSLPRIDEMKNKDSSEASDFNIEPIQTKSVSDVSVAVYTHKPADHKKIVSKTSPAASDRPKPIILPVKNTEPGKCAFKTVTKVNSNTTFSPNYKLYNSGEEEVKLPPRININTNVVIKMPPKSYFDYPNSKNDELINIGKNEILLTTTKIPPNFKQFLEFRRQVWRDLKMFNGLRLDIEPNGQVTLIRRQQVTVSHALIMLLQDKIDKFYEQTRNTNTGVPSEKYIETKQTQTKINKNTCPGNFNENNSNNNIEAGILETSIISNPSDMHMKQGLFEKLPCLLSPQALNDAVQSKVGNIVSSSLSPVTWQSELDYAYYRNGLFFVFNFDKVSLRPIQVIIKNTKKACREPEQAKKLTCAKHSLLQNDLDEVVSSFSPVLISKNRKRRKYNFKQTERNRKKTIKHSNEQLNLIKIAPKPSITPITPITISNESASQPLLVLIPPVTVLSTSSLGNDGNVNIKQEEELPAVNIADSLFDVKEEYILGE